MSRERKVTVEHERGADEYSGRDVCVRLQATSSTSVELYLTESEARQVLRGLLRVPGFDDAMLSNFKAGWAAADRTGQEGSRCKIGLIWAAML